MRRACVAAAVALTGAWAADAVAVTPVGAVVGPAGRAYDPFSPVADLGAGRSGVVGWTVTSPRDVVQVAVRARTGRTWGRPVTVGAGTAARVAITPAGRWPAVAWTDGGRVRVALRDDVRGRWVQQALPPGVPTGVGVRVSDLAVRGRGAATVVLETRSAEAWRVRVLDRDVRGRWRSSPPLRADDAAGGQAAVDGSGAVTAVWLAVARDGTELRAATRRPGGAWSRATTIARAGAGAVLTEPQVAVSVRGDVVVLAGRQADASDGITSRVVWKAPGRPWRTSRTVSALGMAVGSGGAVWVARRTGTGIGAVRLQDSGAWGRAETVASTASATVVGGPGAVVVAGGRPVVWWTVDGSPTPRDRWFAAERLGPGWSSPARVALTNGAVAFAAGGGSALAAYVSPTAGGRVVAVDLRTGR